MTTYTTYQLFYLFIILPWFLYISFVYFIGKFIRNIIEDSDLTLSCYIKKGNYLLIGPPEFIDSEKRKYTEGKGSRHIRLRYFKEYY